MRHLFTIAALAPGLALAACGQAPDTYSAACAVPLSHWGTEKDGVGHHLPIISVFVASDGTVLWNKEAISNAELRAYMDQASGLNPIPQVILQVSPSASCARVEELRGIMDAAPMCRGPYPRCSEGWKPDEWPLAGLP